MDLANAMISTTLQHASVVAASAHTHNVIRWVHVAHHPHMNSDGWKAGDVLLSGAHHWPADDANAIALITLLGRRGLAGIVLAVPNSAVHFSPASIAAAQAAGLPLLELFSEIALSELAEELQERIFLDRSNGAAYDNLPSITSISAALATNSLPDLALSLSKFLKRAVNLANQEGTLLGSKDMTESDVLRERRYIEALHQTGGLKRVQDSMAPVVLEAVPSLGISRRLSCPVRIGGGLSAIIWVDEGDRPFNVNDVRATEHAAIVAALHITHMRALYEQEERLGYAFVGSLLEGRFEDTLMARNRAAINGWNAEASYRICLILLDEPLPLSREGLLRMERFVQRLREQLQQMGAPALLFVSLNQITLLLPANHAPEILWTALGSKGAAMAVSRVQSSAAGMAIGGADVQSMLDLLRPGRIHYFDEVLFSQALLGDRNAREIFVEKRLKPLRDEKSGALLDTLEALCDEGFQLAGASRKLGIHISTLRYRLERIETLLDVTLEDQEKRFELQVAIAMLRLMQR